VHGSDGLDEISISGESKITELKNGKVSTYKIRPEDFGIERASLRDIQGGDALQNAGMIKAILNGERGPRRDIVLLNAAAALLAGSVAIDLKEGIELASRSIDGGAGLKKLNLLVEFTNRGGSRI
jgi:anthranilate phosphoribosyltransferase